VFVSPLRKGKNKKKKTSSNDASSRITHTHDMYSVLSLLLPLGGGGLLPLLLLLVAVASPGGLLTIWLVTLDKGRE